ncbi:MAG TPA: tripartite tricarboxylate transporter TctB family protein [Thermoanaerobacterales bacterium]|nr:Tripartite tricarboxylate transporter TctB family [Thermoanaerobacteraceae bacterium]HHW02309.1 tripartite tricarboxylate transporter TctB family protein [Thermoanaerobacterales bacterium]
MSKKSKAVSSQHELYFAAFVTILGLVALVMAFGFSPRARILPIPVTLLLTIMGLVQFWNSWKQMTFEKSNKDTGISANATVPFYRNPLLMTIICILIYPLLLKFLGFIVSSLLAMVYLMRLRGVKSWFTTSVFSIITPILVYYLFNVIGGTNFPKGPWGF